MGLADRVAADDERNRLLVVHRHPPEGLANVPGRSERARDAVRALRVHVDQAHLNRPQRAGQLPLAAVALVPEPGVLGPPEDLLRCPDVLPPEAEAERLEPHRLVGTVAREDDQVGPRELAAVLLLDRPQQPAGLVEADVVGPAVEGSEALCAAAATASPVGNAVGAGRMPAHPDEQPPVVAVVRRPPVLRRRQHREDVLLQRLDVEGLELLGVVEVLAKRVGSGRALENLQVRLVGPPVRVRLGPMRAGGRGGDYRAFGFAAVLSHVGSSPVLYLPLIDVSFARSYAGAAAHWGQTAPVDDLGLVDREALLVRGGQARGRAHGAVDIGDGAARPAYDVVVVVPDPRLIPRQVARRLKPPDQTRRGQRPQHVVHGLLGDLTEVGTHDTEDRLRVGVRMLVHRGQHRYPRTRDPQRDCAQYPLQVRRRWHALKSGSFPE